MVKQQLLVALLEDVRLWVTERKPKGSAEAGQLAEDYPQARSTENTKPAKQEKKIQERPPPGSAQSVALRDTGRVNAPIGEQNEMRPDHSGTLNLRILKE